MQQTFCKWFFIFGWRSIRSSLLLSWGTTVFFLFDLLTAGLQIIFFMESIIEHAAKLLGMSPDEVRKINMYKKGDVTMNRQPLTNFNLDEILSRKNANEKF